MRALVVAAVMLAGVSTAMAGPCGEGVPPKQFRQAPTVPYAVKLVDETGIFSKCHVGSAHAGGTLVLWGCVKQVNATSFVIYVNQDTTSGERDCIVAHEKAHLPPNNWSPNHGNRAKRAKWKVDQGYEGPNPIY